MAPEVPAVQPNVEFEQLGRDIRARLEADAPKVHEVADMEECIQKLQDAVKRLGPEWRVQTYGSAAAGLSTSGSDLDATCFREGSESEQDSQLAIQELKEKLGPLLQRHPRFDTVEEVMNTRVPILRLKFDQRIDVDLSCFNMQAVQNSALQRAYVCLDPIVRQLVMAIKLWAKAEAVVGAPMRHLSSYSLTLMAIYFLQVDQTTKAPRIPVSAFGLGGSVAKEVLQISWRCTVSLPQLVARFFKFFADEFDWGSEVVSARLGQRTSSSDEVVSQLAGKTIKRLHIEDPYILSRNLNCVLGLEQESRLLMALREASAVIQAGGTPAGLKPAFATMNSPMPVAARVIGINQQLSMSPPPPPPPPPKYPALKSEFFDAPQADQRSVPPLPAADVSYTSQDSAAVLSYCPPCSPQRRTRRQPPVVVEVGPLLATSHPSPVGSLAQHPQTPLITPRAHRAESSSPGQHPLANVDAQRLAQGNWSRAPSSLPPTPHMAPEALGQIATPPRVPDTGGGYAVYAVPYGNAFSAREGSDAESTATGSTGPPAFGTRYSGVGEAKHWAGAICGDGASSAQGASSSDSECDLVLSTGHDSRRACIGPIPKSWPGPKSSTSRALSWLGGPEANCTDELTSYMREPPPNIISNKPLSLSYSPPLGPSSNNIGMASIRPR